MSRKTRKLKARIEELRNDVKYHLSNVRILLNNPSLLQVEELKFQYGFFPVRETISGSIRKIERIKDEVKNDNVVAKGVSFGTFSGEEYKFPKEEMESREYHVSKHAPVNMLDNKNTISLPEHWYIRVTHDNVGLLNDYLKTHKHRYKQYQDTWYVDDQWIDGDNCAFFHSDSKDAAHTIPTPMDEYTEVTTEMVKNYMKTWHNINSLVDKSWLVEKDVKLGENYIGDVKFQKSDLLDKSWLEVKKEAARKEAETLTKQTDVNKDGATGYNPVYSPEHLESKKKLFEFAAEKFKECVDQTFNAGLKKESDDQWVLVKVKEGSIIIPPGSEIPTMVKGMPRQDIVRVGDLKKRADALEKCTDQECKPIGELPKTLESLDKIYSFIGLREKSAITNGNKDIIFMKTNNYLNSGRVGYFNTQKPNLMYSPFEMLSDWKSNYVKPLD